MNKEVEKILYTYKKAFSFLSKATRKEIEENVKYSYEIYIYNAATHYLGLYEEMKESDWYKELQVDTKIDTDELTQELGNDLTSKTCSINGETFVLFLYERSRDETRTYFVPVEVAKKLQLHEYEGQELDYYDDVFDDIQQYEVKHINTYNTD